MTTHSPAKIDLSTITTSNDCRDVLGALASVGMDLARLISRGPLGGTLDAAVGTNSDGDGQKALDVMADEAFAAAFVKAPVRWLASEEREEIDSLNPAGTLGVAIDPLDGSSNINANVSIGTIFSVFETAGDATATFLRPGREQIAAGYIVYGPQTTMVFTVGNGVHAFIVDWEADRYVELPPLPAIPQDTSEYAINSSNQRNWVKPVMAYVADCNVGEDGPRGRNFNMRWVASLVAEAHRILSRGGIFLYPGDARKGYANGRLRAVYECAPIAMLIEQAGGRATNGTDRILDQTPEALHARTPLVFGSANEVARVAVYHDLPESEISPLFGKRGLFSS